MKYDDNDLEAARGVQSPCTPLSKTLATEMEIPEEAMREFELNRDRNPAEWMRVRNTTGETFLWFTVLLQTAIVVSSIVFLSSHDQNQLSWKTGCWGLWTSLADADGVDFVEFETNIGWQFFGKEGQFGLISRVSEHAAVVGGLAGAMHTLLVLVVSGFFFFSLSALWLSQNTHSHKPEQPTKGFEETSGSTKPRKRDNPLDLARDCHRWMLVLAAINIFAGVWCLGIGCIAFYVVVVGDFTDGLEDLVSEWGESVTCTVPQTTPYYGFFANGLSVLLLLGGGFVSFYMARSSDLELGEAVEIWKNDRAEIAEMASRKAMIEKKAAYAAAAASAGQPTSVSIFKRKGATTTTYSAAAAAATAKKKAASQHNIDLLSIGFDSDDGADSGAAPAYPAPSSLNGDLESGSAAAGVSTCGAFDDTGAGAVGEDLPPPEGWEARTTPSGEKFWVNTATRDVSWERPAR